MIKELVPGRFRALRVCPYPKPMMTSHTKARRSRIHFAVKFYVHVYIQNMHVHDVISTCCIQLYHWFCKNQYMSLSLPMKTGDQFSLITSAAVGRPLVKMCMFIGSFSFYCGRMREKITFINKN